MNAITLEEISADDEAFFQLFGAVRADDLGMHGWDPPLRDRILRFQFQAQRQGYRQQYSTLQERLILRDGSAVGWVIVHCTDAVVCCVDLAIAPEARNGGIGTGVLRGLQREAGDRPLTLTVLRLNVRALALYNRLGFRTVSEVDLHVNMEWRR
jgi:ribosomal protein S18 acetylase RimI-like enzyme